MLISTSHPGLLRLLISESNKRRSPGYEVVLIFEISQASFLISCFSLKISCEIKKNSWQHAAGLSHALKHIPTVFHFLHAAPLPNKLTASWVKLAETKVFIFNYSHYTAGHLVFSKHCPAAGHIVTSIFVTIKPCFHICRSIL